LPCVQATTQNYIILEAYAIVRERKQYKTGKTKHFPVETEGVTTTKNSIGTPIETKI
jgi:hypothetical protein